MAYEYDPITGRNTAERKDFVRTGRSGGAPWLLAAAIVAALVALLWIFGGTADQTPAVAPAGDVAPMGTAPGMEGGTAPAIDGGTAPGGATAPAPAAPVE